MPAAHLVAEFEQYNLLHPLQFGSSKTWKGHEAKGRREELTPDDNTIESHVIVGGKVMTRRGRPA